LLRGYNPIEAHYQGSNPDCAAHAAAAAIEILNGIEHALFEAPAPREVRVAYIYAKSKLSRQAGASVEDVVDVLQKGFLWGSYDYSEYKKLRSYSSKLDARIKTVHQIRTFEEAANAIKSLQPVIISSNVKLGEMDEEGFVKFISKKSGHAWCLIGIDDRSDRPGGLLLSSWGDTWGENGAAWVDAATLEIMLQEYGSSYAISDLVVLDDRRVVYYSSPSCGACVQYKPIIAKFPEIETAAEHHNVSPVPQVWIISAAGTETLIGAQTEETLREFLK
jgi:hypothetical protein